MLSMTTTPTAPTATPMTSAGPIPPAERRPSNPLPWRVGELARRTGLSVRTLHHWHGLELLVPSHRSPAGHRLYTAADLVRLQQIVALRGLGMALTDIRAALADPATTHADVVRRRLESARAHLALERQLCEGLERIAAALDRGAPDVGAEQLIRSVEVMTMIDRHHTPEQLERRRRLLGGDRITEAQAEWADLIDEVRTAVEDGTDPASPAGRQLARRWNGLVGEFSGGDAEIVRSLHSLDRDGPDSAVMGSDHRRLFAFIGRASAAAAE